MSKKKNKNSNKKKNRYEKKKDPAVQVLSQMLKCNSACGDIGEFEAFEEKSGHEHVNYCVEHLPGFSFVEKQFINYMFSDGLSAGGTAEDEILNEFLYRVNDQDVTNLSVLRDAVRMAHCRYGECGIRWKDGNIYLYKSGTYAPLISTEEGIQTIVAYIATTDGSYINEKEQELKDLEWISRTLNLNQITKWYEEHDMILLDKMEFVSLRNDTSKLHGEAPLEKDRLRVDLLISVYERLNYDVNYDGPGRILFPVKNGYINDDENEISTTRIVKMMGDKDRNNSEALQEIERITNDIRESSSDAAIAISNGFGEPIHLPRVTKATEFLEWVQQREGEILADDIELPPSLLEEGDLSGNVSMERIVDNAMENSIVPHRTHYAPQFSAMFAYHLGLQKVFFGKYHPRSEESDTQKYTKITAAIQALAIANDKEQLPELTNVIKSFAEMLDYSTHDSLGNVVELSIDDNSKKKRRRLWQRNKK